MRARETWQTRRVYATRGRARQRADEGCDPNGHNGTAHHAVPSVGTAQVHHDREARARAGSGYPIGTGRGAPTRHHPH